MGCHTWIEYVPKELPTREEMFENVRKSILKNLSDFTEKQVYETMNVFKWKRATVIRIIKDYCDELAGLYNAQESDLRRLFAKYNNRDWCYDSVNDRLYKELGTGDSIFRKYGYPDVHLTTREEVKEYYLNPENKCYAHYDFINEQGEKTWDEILAGINKEADEQILKKIDEVFDKYNIIYWWFG